MPIRNTTSPRAPGSSHQIELALFDGPRSDADAQLDRAEAGGVEPSRPTPAPRDSWFPRVNLKKTALWGLALSGSAATLGGAGYGLYQAGSRHAVQANHRNLPPPPPPIGFDGSTAAVAQPPTHFAASPAAFASDAAICTPVNSTQNTELSQVLGTASTAPSAIQASIFTNSTPSGDDIALQAARLQPYMAPIYGTSGMYRAAVLLNLASVDPQFIKGMITQTGPDSVSVRMYTYNGTDNTFQEVHVAASLGELSPTLQDIPNADRLPANAPAWWLLALHAGLKLDNIARPDLGLTAAAHDRLDAKAHERNAIRSIVGVGAEIISSDELDAFRNFEYQPESLNLFDDGAPVGRANVSMSDAGQAVQLLEAKTDNWSSLLGRLSDTRNVCLVTLHQGLDFTLRSWVETNNTGPYFSFESPVSKTSYSGGGQLEYSNNFTSQNLLFQRPGDSEKFLPCGPLSVYSVTNTDAGGAWLRIAVGDDYGSPIATKPQYPFYVPSDALQEISAAISIARRPCAEDAPYQFASVA